MEGQSPAGNSQHHYQSVQWSRLVRRNTLADASPATLPPSLAPAPQLPTQIDLLPILLPQQSVYHQAQLAQYNRLITSGRATRSTPLPPLVSTQNIQAVPGSRSSSNSGNTARNTKSSARGGHGNKESRKPSKGERALITEKENSATMPGKKLELSNQLPNRPHPQHQHTNLSQQSSSVPSTPHQHARKFSFSESREPSPNATNSHSPRSAYSESNITLPSRPIPGVPRGGCRYETAMAHTKRRIHYSIGTERLEKLSASSIKSKLSEDEERTLSTDMRELYDRLLPTEDSENRRKNLVQKLEKLFNEAWPGHDIQVHVFGSSGNLLCTDESDVDICITTDWKELEGVCIIADLLAKNGMEKVICVSTAKIPIVKMWDPELRLHCDMNVNNDKALENTRMIKTYVQIDPRVRQLAMIVKHWTKQRVINDAAFGLTLSSYTWICMIINFLQSRTPPIVPALHQRPHWKLPPKDGQKESEFADDLNALKSFSKKNKETLGELLFHFFRFYGHEFDYDKLVISVRNGKQITKAEKKWHLANGHPLCVEEPFNVERNLGNTADETTFRGLHIEIRRAFDLVSQAKLEECCEQYQFPKEEERVFQKPPPKPKPVLRSTSQSSRGGRGGHRGGRSSNRNGNSNRRASSSAFDSNSYAGGLPPNMTAQDVWLQRQAQAQLHNDLFTTYSVLQAQENSLRLQLYNQSQGYMQAQQNQAYAQSQQGPGTPGGIKQQTADRNRTSSFDQPPLTAPIRPDAYYYPLNHYLGSPMYGYQSPSTNPSSPSLSAAVPELRRSMHRSSITNGSGAGGQSASSMRSHSQPATRSQLSVPGSSGMSNPGLGIFHRQANAAPIPNFHADESSDVAFESRAPSVATTPPEDTTPREYVGYYINESVPSPMRREPIMAIPAFGDLNQGRRRLSTDQLPPSILDRLKRSSRSPSPLGHDRSYSTGAHSVPLSAVPSQQSVSSSNLRALNTQAPLVVNGSNVPAPVSIPNWQQAVSVSSNGDHGGDTPVGSMDSMSQVSGNTSDFSGEQDLSGQATPKDFRTDARADPPMVVNGSNTHQPDFSPTFTPPNSTAVSNGLVATEQLSLPRLSPNSRNRLARQNGGMSPLDIGASQNENPRDDMSHLSPVYETRTPSPTANRKFEPLTDRKVNSYPTRTRSKEELSKSVQKPSIPNGNPTKSQTGTQQSNGHTRAAKSEGGGTGWQQQKKSKQKMKSAPNGQPLSEKLPSNNSERKGG